VALIGTTMVFPNIARVWITAIVATVLLAAVKYSIIPLFALQKVKAPKPKSRLDTGLFYTASAFMPSILLFNLYNDNRVENHIVFSHVLIFAGFLAIVGVLLYYFFKRISGSSEAALLLSFLFWICFWLFEAMYGAVRSLLTALSPTVFMTILAFILVGGAILLRISKPRFLTGHPVYRALTAGLFVIFIINLVPGVSHEIVLQRAIAARLAEGENAPFYIKREFYIDESLPTPDIYWLHLDGMMSMETVERFWGECQDDLREELSRRGFLVYADAELNAGATTYALPALLSPTFYDSFWGEQLSQVDTELMRFRRGILNDKLTQVGVTVARDIAPQYELFAAFAKRGYGMYGLRESGTVWPSVSYAHTNDNAQGLLHNFIRGAGDFPELLSLTTPFNISIDTVPDENIRFVITPHLTIESLAQFTWIVYMDTHMTEVWRHDLTLSRSDHTAIHVYPRAYAYIANKALIHVDNILNGNPNAVIILQADHGFHFGRTQQFLLDQGYSLEQVIELNHSVFSAVRIPAEYGGLGAPIAPLNISRELVNRFVGQNYKLLP